MAKVAPYHTKSEEDRQNTGTSIIIMIIARTGNVSKPKIARKAMRVVPRCKECIKLG